MDQTSTTNQPVRFDVLRRFAPKKVAVETCDLCTLALASEHQHLIEPAQRRILCSCAACAVLFSNHSANRYRAIPRNGKLLSNFCLTDEQWDELAIPIGLAFFFHSSPRAGKSMAAFADARASDTGVYAFYPSPAGATESLLDLAAWNDLKIANPVLEEMLADVEALLVNRIGGAREYYIAPIDDCYKLVGLIRAHWRGLSGGEEVWKAIGEFFVELNRKCC